MKKNPLSVFLLLATALIACNNDKGPQKTESATTTAQETTGNNDSPGETTVASNGGITGSWKLDMEVFDDNGNWIMEPEERAKAYKNNYSIQLRPNGSARIQDLFNGRYEVKEEKGRQMLYVYRERVVGQEDEDPAPDKFHITSVAPNELILQVVMMGEPSSFWIFKRVG